MGFSTMPNQKRNVPMAKYAKRPYPQRPPQQKKFEITCDPNELSDAECNAEGCNSTLFDKALKKKVITSVHPQNPTGKELYLDQLVTLCRKCGAIFE